MKEYALKDLDENGIIKIGTRAKEGDMLVGKVWPKRDYDSLPEAKLLRAISGEPENVRNI